MIKMHEFSSGLRRTTEDEFLEFFRLSVIACRKLKELSSQLQQFQTGDLDEDEIFEIFENFNLMTQSIFVVTQGFTSVINAHNKYLIRTGKSLETLMNNINTIVDDVITPEEREIEILQNEISSVIGGLSYFLYMDFNMWAIEEVKEGEELEIDSVVYGYVESIVSRLGSSKKETIAKKLAALVKEVHGWMLDYKLKQEVFDEYPEEEEAFMRVVGPDYVEIPESALTIDVVRKVIDGKTSVEELLQMYQTTEGADNEVYAVI